MDRLGKNVQLSAITLRDYCPSVFFFAVKHQTVDEIFSPLPRKIIRQRPMFFIRPDVEQETRERNIQQRNVHDRSEPSPAEFVDQHHFARSKNMYTMISAIKNEQEDSWIHVQDI